MRQARTRHDDSVAVQPASTSTTAARLDVQRGDRPASSITLDSAICCVIDVETTGVDLAVDRIVELAVVRCDAHGQVLDEWHTLIDPQCAMGAEWVHGIDDGMVAGAPTFADVAPRLLQSLDGAVLVAHNASFDHRFVSAELRGAGYDVALPYLCTMHVRRHVGLPAPVTHRLAWACWHAGQPIDHAHAAVSDARATAALMGGYLRLARGVGHATLERLAATAAAANACVEPVLRVSGGTSQGQLRPRKLTGAASPFARSPAVDAAARYRQAVEEAVEDLQIDGEEVDRLHALVLELGLCAEQIAEAHRQFVEGRLEGYLDDEELSWEEYEQLRLLARLLAVDPLWLVDLVGDRRPQHPALVLDAVELGGTSGAQPDDDSSDTDLLIAPLSVCFTGPFEAFPMTRAEVQLLATDAGMHVRPGVSGKLDLLVCRDPHAGTGKLRKAEAQGTVVIDQHAFLALAGATTPTPAPTETVLAEVGARRRARVAASARAKPAAGRAADTAQAAPRPAAAGGEQVLWCEVGAHEWRRQSQRGRPPGSCPEH